MSVNLGANKRRHLLFETGDWRYVWLTRLQGVGVGTAVKYDIYKYDIYALKTARDVSPATPYLQRLMQPLLREADV